MEIHSIEVHKTNSASVLFSIGQTYFLANKCSTPDARIKTMIFLANKDGRVQSWTDLYTDRLDKDLLLCIKEFEEMVLKNAFKEWAKKNAPYVYDNVIAL